MKMRKKNIRKKSHLTNYNIEIIIFLIFLKTHLKEKI